MNKPSSKSPPRRSKSVLIAAVLASLTVSSVVIAPAPAQANPFKGVFKGIVSQFKGTGLGIIKTAISNPVGTFRLLNQRVFKIDGTEKYLKYYDKYGKYLKYVPGVGGQTIPASLVIDIAGQQAGLKNGVPQDLNAILDEIYGPAKNNGNGNGSGNCISAILSCGNGQYTSALEQIQREAVIGSTGALGIPDPTVVKATINEASRRGLTPDKLISNPVVARTFATNETARLGAEARVQSRLAKEGQQESLDRIKALDLGLQGINQTATTGVKSRITQDIVRALLSVETQKAGILTMQAIQAEQQGIDNAMILNQLSNSSKAQDSIRRGRDTKLNAEAARLIHLTRRRIRF